MAEDNKSRAHIRISEISMRDVGYGVDKNGREGFVVRLALPEELRADSKDRRGKVWVDATRADFPNKQAGIEMIRASREAAKTDPNVHKVTPSEAFVSENGNSFGSVRFREGSKVSIQYRNKDGETVRSLVDPEALREAAAEARKTRQADVKPVKDEKQDEAPDRRAALADEYNNLSVEQARRLPDVAVSDMALAAQEEAEDRELD